MKDFDYNGHIGLENARVRIEPLLKEHVPLIKDIILKDTGLMKYSSIPLTNEEELEKYVDIAQQARQDMIRYPFLVFDKQSGKYAGSTSYVFVSNKDRRLEIGFTWIGFDFQRTGLNRAMKYLMMQYAFETLEFARVEYRADSRNVQSRTAIEAIGATFEGELRSYVLKYDGVRTNTVFYSILAHEWPQVKKDRFADLIC